jgi:AraC family transcriptional regulator
MHVTIVDFAATRVAALEHEGSTEGVDAAVLRLVRWRMRNDAPPGRHATFGVHHHMRTHADSGYRIDLCVAFDREVVPNPEGIVAKTIPATRCAHVRHVGARAHVPVVRPHINAWLPAHGERRGAFPPIFHYVNVGPSIHADEMIADIYVPLA